MISTFLKAFYRLPHLALCAWLVAGVCAIPFSAQATSAPPTDVLKLTGDQTVEIPARKALHIILPKDAKEVLVADPEVAEIVVKTPRTAYLIGQKVGDTNAFFMDSAGRKILTLDIRVEKDLAALRSSIRDLMPGAEVSVKASNDDIILSGQVPSSEVAENIRRLARHFVAGDTNITNLLSIARPEQVLIQVRVTEMRRSVAKKLGISLSGSRGKWDVTSGVQTSSGTAFADKFLRTLFTGNILGFVDFQALIEALEEDGYIKTLAEPNLTALSGEEASFLAGGEFPVPTGRDRDGNVTLEFKPFGVGLKFTPVVMDGGRINMKISTEVSALSTDGALIIDDFNIPALTVRRAETTVEIPSGGSLVLGGLLRNDASNQVRGVPWLADLPIIGPLFRSTDFQREETELVVIAIPYVVKPTAPGQLTTPTDHFSNATDGEQLLLGKLYSRYSIPQPTPTSASEPVGFIVD